MAQRVSAADPASTAIKAVAAMEALADARSALGLSEIARHIESSRSSTLRVLRALERKRLIAQDPSSRRYRLTLRLLELGTQVLDQLQLPDLARSHLRALSDRTGETAHLGILDDWHVVFIGKAEPLNPIRLHARIGWRAPSHCTSLGKAMLSRLPEERLDEYFEGYDLARLTERTITSRMELVRHLRLVRQRGYAVDAQEHRVGICCVGAPVVGPGGDVVAAVSISGPAFRMQGRRLAAMAPDVKEAAAAISRELGS